MAIYQTNLWVCEVCHKSVPDCKEVGAYDDPVVTYPPGGEWEFILVDGKEVLACPACVAAAAKPDTLAGAALADVQVIDCDALTSIYIPLRREEGQ